MKPRLVHISILLLFSACAAFAQTGATFSYDASGNRWSGYPSDGQIFITPASDRYLFSSDPYVQAPDFTQNLNRYCYCLGNPLKYTDPEGERSIVSKIFMTR